MTYSILWTTVPAGRHAGNRLRLSLVASPRVEAPVDQLAGSPLADWPALVGNLGPLALQVAGQPALRPLTRLSPEPSSELWRRLLPAGTRVTKPVPGVRRLATTPKESYVLAAESIAAVFDDRGGAGPVLEALRRMPDDPRVEAALPASARARGPLALDRLTAGELAATARTLRRQGHGDAARALPIAAHAGALRSAPAQIGPTAPLAGIDPIDQSDFHQLVGMVLDHPVLAVAVGLRIDLTASAEGLDGVQLIRVVAADGRPLDGDVPRPQPWSRVRVSGDRFVMEAAGEIRDGLLDLSPDPERGYLVTGDDVTGLSAHLLSMSQDTPPGTPPRLPIRRNAGLTLAQSGRPSAVVEAALDRAQDLFAVVDGVDGAPVLTAADVTVGYRLDVRTDGGDFRSLMRRRARYQVGTGTGAIVLSSPTPDLPDAAEGRVQRAVAVQQPDGEGVPRLRVGEEIAQWDGWALSAPRPGRTVTGEPGSSETTADIEPAPIPGVPLTVRVTAEPGSVPRLRFGHEYEFRGRAVYLGGVSLPPDIGDDTLVSAASRYLRTESLSPPVLVHRRRNSEGESATRLVVRSDGDGVPIGELCERHVAAPKSSVHLAEWHGAFDAAFGPDSPERAAARAALLKVARRESGTFLDPTVLGPDGSPLPAPGIAVVTNDPTQVPDVQLPIRRGEGLPNGVYVVHDTPAVRLPYLPEVPAAGAALAGLTPEPVILPFAGGWPDVAPGRLVVHPTNAAIAKATVKQENGRPVLHVELPPGVEQTVLLSSTVRPDRLGELDLGPAPDIDAVLKGQSERVSAVQPLTLVHAVRKPITPPRLAAADRVASAGALGVTVTADLECHRDSTGRVDLEAEWTETVDTGTGPVRPAQRRAVVGSVVVERGGGPVPAEVTHHLGDTAHRLIGYTPVAVTRFAEYFAGRAAGAEGQRRGETTLLDIPNRAVPPEPDVHSVVPIYESTRSFAGGTWTFTRRGAGVRVLLRRKWNVTGDGEQLGVVAFANTQAGKDALAAEDGRLDLVSRWGSDPLQETSAVAVGHVTMTRFGRRDLATSKELPLLDATAKGVPLSIAAHRVEFDAARDLWFADVDLSITETRWPFVRLGVVRYQPSSLSDCRISRVVRTDFVQLPASRTVEVRRVGAFGVSVAVFGKAVSNATFSIRQERRLHAPAAAGIDLYSDAGLGAANGWTITNTTADTEGALAAFTLNRGQPLDPNDPVIADLFHGRVVVEERQTGMSVAGPGTDSRVIFTETVDRALIGIGSFAPQPSPST